MAGRHVPLPGGVIGVPSRKNQPVGVAQGEPVLSISGTHSSTGSHKPLFTAL